MTDWKDNMMLKKVNKHFLFIIFLLSFINVSSATVTLIPDPVFCARDQNGNSLAGGKLYTYASGTSTLLSTYTDYTAGTPNSNPVILDSTGCASVWLGNNAYKFNLLDSNNVQQTNYPVNGVTRYSNYSEVASISSNLASQVYASQGAGLVGYRQSSTANGRTVQDRLQDSVSIKDYGAKCDGSTNDAQSIQNALNSGAKHLSIPSGTCIVNTYGGNQVLAYISSRDGFEISGEGPSSIIKLANNAPATSGSNFPIIFENGSSDTLKNAVFRDFTIDLNGQNNLVSTIYENAFYFQGKETNVTFENLIIKNLVGTQGIRVGFDNTANFGQDIFVRNCIFDTFGLGIPGWPGADQSVLYLEADNIQIIGNKFFNPSFSFNLSIGNTAIEVHGQNNTIIQDNYFTYSQLPILLSSQQKPMLNTLIQGNNFIQTNYMFAFDNGPDNNSQSKVIVDSNFYNSTVAASSIIPIGSSGEGNHTRDFITFSNNTMDGSGNSNQETHIFKSDSTYLRSLMAYGNNISTFNGAFLYFSGTALNSPYTDISVFSNKFDSLGQTSGSYPSTPEFIAVVPSSGTVNSLSFRDNELFNTSGKNYTTTGFVIASGNINYINIDNNKVNFGSNTVVRTGSLGTNLYRNVQNAFFQNVPYYSVSQGVASSGTTNLASFAGYGINNYADYTINLFATDGATNNANNVYECNYTTTGSGCTLISGKGNRTADILLSYSGTTLVATNNYASLLTMSFIVTKMVNNFTNAFIWQF